MELKSFSPQETKTWQLLYQGLDHSRKAQAHPLFVKGIEALGFTNQLFPDLPTVSTKLRNLTGWQPEVVTGLEDGKGFFTLLSQKKFPVGNFIRDQTDLSYTPEPDIFHDLYGHIPFLVDPDYADFCFQFGTIALAYLDDPQKLRQLERLFWFGVEFPLIHTEQGLRIFGGGILSSAKECNYCLSPETVKLPFNLHAIMNKEFRIDQLQKEIFVLEDEQQLYQCISAIAHNFRLNETDSNFTHRPLGRPLQTLD